MFRSPLRTRHSRAAHGDEGARRNAWQRRDRVTYVAHEFHDLLLWATPHGIVESVRSRRMLRRLGAVTTRPGAARLACEARLDLLPPQALRLLDTVIDVGANEGRWSMAVAVLARPRRLIAVEPSPEILPRLRAAIGGINGVAIVEAAALDSVGEATLHLTAHSHNASLFTPRTTEMDGFYGSGYAVTGQARVTTTTLDEITRDVDEVSLLKIDAQGAERAVLAGAAQALAKTRWLLIEANFRSHYEGDMLFSELHALLARCGFALSGLSAPHVREGIALWCDCLYTRT